MPRKPPGDCDYEVGYGKPPRHSRFRKGRSGNPKGRPCGSRNLAILLQQALDEPVAITENGRRRIISKREALAKQIANRAVAGDHRAAKLLIEALGHEAEAGYDDAEQADQQRRRLGVAKLSPQEQRALLELLRKTEEQ